MFAARNRRSVWFALSLTLDACTRDTSPTQLRASAPNLASGSRSGGETEPPTRRPALGKSVSRQIALHRTERRQRGHGRRRDRRGAAGSAASA